MGVKEHTKMARGKENKAGSEKMIIIHVPRCLPVSSPVCIHAWASVCVCTGARDTARACTLAIKCVSSLKFDDSTRTVKGTLCPLASQ